MYTNKLMSLEQLQKLFALRRELNELYLIQDWSPKQVKRVDTITAAINKAKANELRTLKVLFGFYCEMRRIQDGDSFATATEMVMIRDNPFEIFSNGGYFEEAHLALEAFVVPDKEAEDALAARYR